MSTTTHCIEIDGNGYSSLTPSSVQLMLPLLTLATYRRHECAEDSEDTVVVINGPLPITTEDGG